MPITLPQLDDTTYADLVAEALRRVPRHAPEWTDHNPSDPGITLIELFAWLSEAQIYRLDQITAEHVRKSLALLGTAPRAAQAARAALRFAASASAPDPLHVPAQTRVFGRPLGGEQEVVFTLERALWVVPLTLTRIERLDASGRADLTEAYQRGPYIYALGGELDAAVRADSRLQLGFDRPFPAVEISLSIRLYEADLPALPPGSDTASVVSSAQTLWEYRADGGAWRPLTVITDGSRGLEASGILRFMGPTDAVPVTEGGATHYWLRLRVLAGGYEIPPRIAEIALNETIATEGEEIPWHIIGQGTGLPMLTLTVTALPVQAESLDVEVAETSAIWQAWQRVADFAASGPFDRHYTLDAARGLITFGDGLHGRVAPPGSDIRARYRRGGGVIGNLARGEITTLREPSLSSLSVTNPFPATGGTAAENLDQAWARARAELIAPTRAVTAADYETLARATPGLRVARAVAVLNDTRDCHVHVIVVPYSVAPCPVPSAGFLRTVCQHLDPYRLLGTRLRVLAVRYAHVTVDVRVTVAARYKTTEVERRVHATVRAYLDPLRGGAVGAGWPFGRPVYRSELTLIIENVVGVACVTQLRLSLDANTDVAWAEGNDIALAPGALVCPETIRVTASEPSPPCEVQPCRNRVAN